MHGDHESTRDEFPVGAHLVTPRRGYLHHGIYVGHGRVVHYAGIGRRLRRGPVEEVSLAEFTRGRAVWLRSGAASVFDSGEIVDRARSRVGEHSYRILTNNCEHFVEWCIRGEPRSLQVEAWLTQPLRTFFCTLISDETRACHGDMLGKRSAPTFALY